MSGDWPLSYDPHAEQLASIPTPEGQVFSLRSVEPTFPPSSLPKHVGCRLRGGWPGIPFHQSSSKNVEVAEDGTENLRYKLWQVENRSSPIAVGGKKWRNPSNAPCVLTSSISQPRLRCLLPYPPAHTLMAPSVDILSVVDASDPGSCL